MQTPTRPPPPKKKQKNAETAAASNSAGCDRFNDLCGGGGGGCRALLWTRKFKRQRGEKRNFCCVAFGGGLGSLPRSPSMLF
jgi:hypothetical protein